MLPLNDTLGRQHNDLYIHCSSILWRLIVVFFDDFELYHLRFKLYKIKISTKTIEASTFR
jgi:hypothetical protein